MGRYVFEDCGEFVEVSVGCESLGAGCEEGPPRTLFLQCFKDLRDDHPRHWYPRLENMHELELLLDWHRIKLPAVVLQQLEGELLDKPPSICLGNRVYLPGGHQAPGASRFVRATSTARLLIEEADGSSRWVSRAGAKLDVYAEPLSMEDELELLMGEDPIDPEEPPRAADNVKVIEYRAPTETEIAEDFALLRRLLHTRGLFSRAISSH